MSVTENVPKGRVTKWQYYFVLKTGGPLRLEVHRRRASSEHPPAAYLFPLTWKTEILKSVLEKATAWPSPGTGGASRSRST